MTITHPPIAAELDASGLHCPLPLLKAKKALARLESGQVLRVVATDPGALRDFDAYARQVGHRLLEASDRGDHVVLVVQKA
ncbi:MAG: sulfurtransferase TusA family protein [Candidatus Competibacterales bacterium]